MIVIKDLRADVLGEPLFEKVNLVIRTGERVGIVGSNKSDLTTFLRVISSDVEMDEGTVALEGDRLAFVAADVFSESPDKLAQIFHSRPTFLILDLNDISTGAVETAKRFIESFRGGLLIASSTPRLMSSAKITRVLELHSSTKSVSSYTGDYASFVIEKEKNDTRLNEAYEKQQREKRRLEGWLEQKRLEASIDRSPEKGATIRAKVKYLKREILDKEIPKPADIDG